MQHRVRCRGCGRRSAVVVVVVAVVAWHVCRGRGCRVACVAVAVVTRHCHRAARCRGCGCRVTFGVAVTVAVVAKSAVLWALLSDDVVSRSQSRSSRSAQCCGRCRRTTWCRGHGPRAARGVVVMDTVPHAVSRAAVVAPCVVMPR